ncbi:hypothetical protein ABZ642_02335 [Streptomyces sp. NPDC007157]|uniref:hypothetical protein n=1 Tax=Streptomyces sp. NPDC007157 TaxID=3154681 RepID=UPI00340D5904
MGAVRETVRNRGDGLYSYDDRRFMRAEHISARYYSLAAPEGGGGDRGSDSGGYDQLGLGAPMYAKWPRAAARTPWVPEYRERVWCSCRTGVEARAAGGAGGG